MGFFQFFRGGYDKETKKGIDPYKFDVTPVDTYKGYAGNYPVEHGYMIHAHTEEERLRVGKFFFGDSFELESGQDYVASGDYMLCFDKNLRTVFYKKGDSAPERVTKHCKTRNKFYKEWVKPFCEYQPEFTPPCDITGYSFKKGQRYLVCSGSSFGYSYYEILPEIARLESFEEVRLKPEISEYLWNLEPIDLSQSWDRTEEEKADFKRQFASIDEERRKAAEELEERKATPGFCDVCGEPAEYVEDPYYYEMYGEHCMRWLCPACYHDSCMDV